MTIREVSSQILTLSVDHKLNGEHFSKQRLENCISHWFRGDTKIANRIVMTILLPDGEWYFTIDRCPTDPTCYGYTIPDTREEEQRIIDALFS